VPLLIVLFIVVPLLELYVILQVGDAIGALNTIVLLVLASVVGSVLLRIQGRAAWRRFQDAVRSGRPPAREVVDGALIIFGAALLLTPGFLSDILGVLLLLPPTRALVRGVMARTLLGRIAVMTPAGPFRPAAGSASHRPRHPSDDVVEGTASEVDPTRKELP
jgi:UPF0716 protein FxsA